jgi:lysophospholipase L1-like esterase
MVVGDSCVFGWEAPEGENFPERLLQMLEQEYPNRPFHLFQGGVMGYSTYQTRRILEIYGPEYRPDLVVVYANTNDAWPCVEYPDKEVVNKSMRKYSLQQALEYSEFYCLLRDILRKTGVVFDPENIEMSEVRQQANYHQGPFRVSREDNYENISAMCEFTREELQADIILLTRQHLLRNGILGKRIMGFNDNTRRVAEEKNVPLVDVDLFFSSHPNERELYFRPERDRIHPNTKGYRQIARLVCEKNKIREYNPARC